MDGCLSLGRRMVPGDAGDVNRRHGFLGDGGISAMPRPSYADGGHREDKYRPMEGHVCKADGRLLHLNVSAAEGNKCILHGKGLFQNCLTIMVLNTSLADQWSTLPE